MREIPTIHSDLCGLSAANPFDAHTSGPRKTMSAGFLSQSIYTVGLENPYLSTGIDMEFSKTTLSITMDCNAEIIDVIDRYPENLSDEYMSKNNPQKVIIYRNTDTNAIDIIDVQSYLILHQTFGIKYKFTDALLMMAPNQHIKKGTVLAEVPNVSEEGFYKTGLNANIVFIDDESGIEDGILILDEFSDKLMPTAIIVYEFNIADNEFPRNVHGTPDNFKCMLDIGDVVPSHGIIFATTEYDPIDAIVNMTAEGLCNIDHPFDNKRHGEPGAKVIDIKVVCSNNNPYLSTPSGMEEQLKKYYNIDTRFYKRVLDIYYNLVAKHGISLITTPTFDQFITQSIHRMGSDYRPNRSSKWTEVAETDNVQTLYRNTPIANFRVTVTVEYNPVPDLGNKGAGLHGDKGVTTKKVGRDRMYKDKFGNVADIVSIGHSRINRNIISSHIEQYINASARDLVQRFWQQLDYHQHDYTNNRDRYNHFLNAPKNIIEKCYADYVRYCEILFPRRHKLLISDRYLSTREDVKEYTLFTICTEPEKEKPDGIYHLYPVDNPIDVPEAMTLIEKEFPPFRSTFTFKNAAGEEVETIMEGIVGSVYFKPLEKTAMDCCAVGSAKFSHYGNTAKSSDKYSTPRRVAGNKTIDESGCRSLAGTIGSEILADIMDLANDPIGHRLACENIITHDTPTNIDEIVNRDEHPVGGHRPKNFIKHMFECSGKMIYSPDDEEDLIDAY